ncbi:MAG: zf-HC2 domain-containing protein [Nitrospira sp.]|nr:zf-HC2 domain-containing protein [Nitrospira sp.]
MSWLTHFLPTCQDMSQLLSDALDRRLPWPVRARMFIHLKICTVCEQYQRQLALLRRLLRQKDDSYPVDVRGSQPGLSDEAKGRIRRALESDPASHDSP